MQEGEPEKRESKKTLIIQTLLKYSHFLSTKKIALNIGYQGEEKGCYDYIRLPLKELRASGYLEYKKANTSTPRRGGKPTVYRIKRDWLTLRKLYQDSEFKTIKIDFWKSKWLQKFVINLRCKQHFSKEELGYLHEMLRLSPTFFEYWLLDSLATLEDAEIELALYFNDMGIIVPMNEWVEEPRKGFFECYRDKSFIYYLFFQFCVFSENRGVYSGADLPDEIRKLHEKATQKMASRYLEAINYQRSLEAMNALMALNYFHKNRSDEELNNVFQMVEEYEQKREVYEKMDAETTSLLEKLDIDYNNIAEKIGLVYKRPEWWKGD